MRDLLHLRPKLIFPEEGEDITRVSCDWRKEGMNGRDKDNGFAMLREKVRIGSTRRPLARKETTRPAILTTVPRLSSSD